MSVFCRRYLAEDDKERNKTPGFFLRRQHNTNQDEVHPLVNLTGIKFVL